MKKLILTALLCATIINPANSAYSGKKRVRMCKKIERTCTIQNIDPNNTEDLKCLIEGKKLPMCKKEPLMCKIQK